MNCRPVGSRGGFWGLTSGTCANEMNQVLGHFRAHIGKAGPGEPPDGEMVR